VLLRLVHADTIVFNVLAITHVHLRLADSRQLDILRQRRLNPFIFTKLKLVVLLLQRFLNISRVLVHNGLVIT